MQVWKWGKRNTTASVEIVQGEPDAKQMRIQRFHLSQRKNILLRLQKANQMRFWSRWRQTKAQIEIYLILNLVKTLAEASLAMLLNVVNTFLRQL